MPSESPFVAVAMDAARKVLPAAHCVKRGAILLYQITVDSQLRVISEEQLRHPKRGESAFQTDLCIFEERPVTPKEGGGQDSIRIPRVVMELKTKVTTHDILTYSAKAKKHKQVYPYLRYGLVVSEESAIPGRFFTHNESLDFCASFSGLTEPELSATLQRLLADEIESSQRLEKVVFGRSIAKSRLFRNVPVFDDLPSAR